MKTMRPSRSEFTSVRGLRHHLRRWGSPDAPPLFLLHGWMDVSATFQFLVDELEGDWNVIAPDWRGCGKTQWLHQAYHFSDLLADLDQLLEQLSPGTPATIVGHSMGGNVAGLYAGVRPHRVARLVTLEGIGHWARSAGDTLVNYTEWLDSVNNPGPVATFADRAELAARLAQANPRLRGDRAGFLAEHLGRQNSAGTVSLAVDPYHRVTFSHLLHSYADYRACWSQITAPVLVVTARDSAVRAMLARKDPTGSEFDQASRLACFADVREAMLDDAGHNMHHDQPGALARHIEAFLRLV